MVGRRERKGTEQPGQTKVRRINQELIKVLLKIVFYGIDIFYRFAAGFPPVYWGGTAHRPFDYLC